MKKQIILLIIFILVTAGCTLKEEEYYYNLETDLYNDFNEYYQSIKSKIPTNSNDKKIVITLMNLKNQQYNISKYRNYKTKKLCELKNTYAVIIDDINNKQDYVIEIRYNCDGKKSENYRELISY